MRTSCASSDLVFSSCNGVHCAIYCSGAFSCRIDLCMYSCLATCLAQSSAKT